jgi:hypothetical protein
MTLDLYTNVNLEFASITTWGSEIKYLLEQLPDVFMYKNEDESATLTKYKVSTCRITHVVCFTIEFSNIFFSSLF